MTTPTTSYIEKRFENVIFTRCKTVSINDQQPCFTYVARLNAEMRKVTYAILLVPTNMFSKTETVRIYEVPWIQFQVRTYKNDLQAKNATEAFIDKLIFPQNMETNDLDEPDIEVSQRKHMEDRIVYDIYEGYGEKEINSNYYFILFDDSNELDGANLDSTMNLLDAIDTFNFSITRYSVI